MITKIDQPSLIPQTDIYFIDGSSKGRGEINCPDSHQFSNSLIVLLIHLLWLIHKCLNIVSDSAYIVLLFSAVQTALILSFHSVMLPLLQKVYLVKTHINPVFITHICVHTNLPYFIAEGNNPADILTVPIFTLPE